MAKIFTDLMLFNLKTELQTKYLDAQIGKKICKTKVEIWKVYNTQQDSKSEQMWTSSQYQQ
jgi:hypothetical protein